VYHSDRILPGVLVLALGRLIEQYLFLTLEMEMVVVGRMMVLPFPAVIEPWVDLNAVLD
jgi:hypothetical protein